MSRKHIEGVEVQIHWFLTLALEVYWLWRKRYVCGIMHQVFTVVNSGMVHEDWREMAGRYVCIKESKISVVCLTWGAKGDRRVQRGWAKGFGGRRSFPGMWLQVRGGDVLHIYMGTDGLSWDGVFLTHSLANPANHSHGSWIVPHRYYGNSASRCVLYVCMCVCVRERERKREMMYG
jgi:hypothetical protein